MPITKEVSMWTRNPYYQVECSKCGWNTKAMGGGKAYASSLLAQHNREKHARKAK
jgi:Zn ribbon nucleic-acid-binding protein